MKTFVPLGRIAYRFLCTAEEITNLVFVCLFVVALRQRAGAELVTFFPLIFDFLRFGAGRGLTLLVDDWDRDDEDEQPYSTHK